jgi:hypothetical protein
MRLALAALGFCVLLVCATSAYAAETADWLPLKGTYSNAIGCTWNNGCAGGYHGYQAIDFLVPTGTKVYASGPGTIIQSYNSCAPTNSPGCNGDAGNWVVIAHPDGRQSYYVHLSSVVKASGTVSRGDLIGYSGASGFQVSPDVPPHLHYEERINGSHISPGPMKAVHGTALKQYPNLLGYDNWSSVPAWGNLTIRNDAFKPPVSAWNGVGSAKFLGGDKLTAGQRLHANEYILSNNAQYALVMQKDGNLVLYGHGQAGSGRALWNSKTAGHPGANLVVQGDGNIVIYYNGKALWNTRTVGTVVNRLVMQDDGNLMAYTGSGGHEWASNTAGHPTYSFKGTATLQAGQRLYSKEYLRSGDKRYALLMQEDGNLVLYGPGYHVLWNSRTSGHPGANLVVQGDGNVVIYGGGKALWNTKTVGTGVTRLVVQGDGNLVAYTSTGHARWASNTNGHI